MMLIAVKKDKEVNLTSPPIEGGIVPVKGQGVAEPALDPVAGRESEQGAIGSVLVVR